MRDIIIENFLKLSAPDLKKLELPTCDNISNFFSKDENRISLFSQSEIDECISANGLYQLSDKHDENEIIQILKDDLELVHVLGQMAKNHSFYSQGVEERFFDKMAIDCGYTQEVFVLYVNEFAKIQGVISRCEGFIFGLKSIFENHTVLIKKYDEDELLSVIASSIGSKKNQKRRQTALEWLREELKKNEAISVRKLAIQLSELSKDSDIFDRQIPVSTAKDYVRKIKNE